MGVWDVCVSPLLFMCISENAEQACELQTRAAATRSRGRGSGGGKAHFRCRTSFTEQGQVHSVSLRRTLTAPRGATTGHHHWRRDHVLWPLSGGCPVNPVCPRQPAAGPRSAQNHVLPLTQPDGVQGWRIMGHLGAT